MGTILWSEAQQNRNRAKAMCLSPGAGVHASSHQCQKSRISGGWTELWFSSWEFPHQFPWFWSSWTWIQLCFVHPKLCSCTKPVTEALGLRSHMSEFSQSSLYPIDSIYIENRWVIEINTKQKWRTNGNRRWKVKVEMKVVRIVQRVRKCLLPSQKI